LGIKLPVHASVDAAMRGRFDRAYARLREGVQALGGEIAEEQESRR
jgi:hypothetical protein